MLVNPHSKPLACDTLQRTSCSKRLLAIIAVVLAIFLITVLSIPTPTPSRQNETLRSTPPAIPNVTLHEVSSSTGPSAPVRQNSETVMAIINSLQLGDRTETTDTMAVAINNWKEVGMHKVTVCQDGVLLALSAYSYKKSPETYSATMGQLALSFAPDGVPITYYQYPECSCVHRQSGCNGKSTLAEAVVAGNQWGFSAMAVNSTNYQNNPIYKRLSDAVKDKIKNYDWQSGNSESLKYTFLPPFNPVTGNRNC